MKRAGNEPRRRTRSVAGTILALLVPGLVLPETAAKAAVNVASAADVQRYYLEEFVPTDDAQPHWQGDVVAGNPGTTTPSFRQDVIRRVNWFRAMAGVSSLVTLNETTSARCQQAALMVAANASANHSPPPSWIHYTADGAQAAANSNLLLGLFGPEAVTGYMKEPGSGNYAVAHRRWLLFPWTTNMGTGDVPPTAGHLAANALWVVSSPSGPRPATRDEFVAWPPAGFAPFQVVSRRWSFSFPNADFSGATIAMSFGGNAVALVQETLAGGFGENTVVWRMLGDEWFDDSGDFRRPPTNLVFHVTLSGVRIGGSPRQFEYTATIFDPDPAPAGPAPVPVLTVDGTDVRSAPAVVDDHTILFTTSGKLISLDLPSGEQNWQTTVGSTYSSPTLRGTNAVLIAADTQPGGLRSVDPENGQVHWTLESAADSRMGGALGPDGLAFIGTGNYWTNNQLRTDGRMVAVNANTGALCWEFDSGGEITGGAVVDSGGRLFFGTAQKRTPSGLSDHFRFFALAAATGQELWQLTPTGGVNGSPALDGQGRVFFGTTRDRVYAVDAGSGDVLWEFVVQGACRFASPVVSQFGTVLIGTLSGRLYAIDAASGVLQWSFQTDGEIDSAAAIGRNGRAYFGSGDGRLYALDSATGELLWRFETGRSITRSSPVLFGSAGLALGVDGVWKNNGGTLVYEKGGLLVFADGHDGLSASYWPMYSRDGAHTAHAGYAGSVGFDARTLSLHAGTLEVDVLAPAYGRIRLESFTTGLGWHELATVTNDVERVRVSLPHQSAVPFSYLRAVLDSHTD